MYITWRFPDRALVAFDSPYAAKSAYASVSTNTNFKTQQYSGESAWADDDGSFLPSRDTSNDGGNPGDGSHEELAWRRHSRKLPRPATSGV